MSKTDNVPAQTLSVKCDNHPDRDGTEFTPGNAVKVVLCDECTPDWFKD